MLGHFLPDGDHARALFCLSAHVATGQRQPANIIHEPSISTRYRKDIDPSVQDMRATTNRPRHKCVDPYAHSPSTHLSLAETSAMDADGGEDGRQSARARPSCAAFDHVRS